MIHTFLGILLIALGVGVLWAQGFTTIASVYFMGWILLIAGVAQFFYGVTSGNARRTLFFTILGAVSVFIGLVAVTNPVLSAISFTLLIGALLVISGIYRIIETLVTREENWGWALAGGITSFILGTAIVLTWPLSGLFAIGFFIGIELIINGALLAMQPSILFDENAEYPRAPYLAGVKGGKSKKKTQTENKEHNIDKDYAEKNYTKSRSKKID